MALWKAFDREVKDIIRSLQHQGIVDGLLRDVRDVHTEQLHDPFSFLELILNFCSDSRENLMELAATLGQEMTDFYQVGEMALKIKGGTECIGCCCMAQACRELVEAAPNGSKAECVAIFNRLMQEFSLLEEKLGAIAELEREIILHSY